MWYYVCEGGLRQLHHDLDKLVIAQKFVSQFITSYHNRSIFLTFSVSNPSEPDEKWPLGDFCKFHGTGEVRFEK